MLLNIREKLLVDNARVLRSKASKSAYLGVLIAVVTVVVTTLLVSYWQSGGVSVSGIIGAQGSNYVLWVLDTLPFVFGFWGQYSSTLIASQASSFILEQTEELRLKNEKLEKFANYISTHDPLTDMPNRALFYDRVDQATLSARKHRQEFFLLLVEIENFKEIYDTLGRNKSDILIKQFASRLKGLQAQVDAIARIDTNIFGFLLIENSSLMRTESFAASLRKAIQFPFLIEQLRVPVSSNIGIVRFPAHGEDVDTLVQKAGVALHIAQETNRPYAVYDSSQDRHSPKKLTLMQELRNALQRDELDLFYQPKVSVSNEEVIGAEALIRWNHPEYGLISPDEFIPMAERTSEIKNITLWVLQRAFQNCAELHRRGADIKISVNLSAKDLLDPEFPDLITGIASAAAIKPEWIMFEITEGSVMNDPEGSLEIIGRLHDFGFQFSIDDFGTGYSSLSYLRKMPLSELKIDKSFVMDILQSENDAAIVKATIGLAHNLGLQVTSEGVETREVLGLLKDFGCDVAQGYYFSKPLCFTDFNHWIAERRQVVRN
jgi:diguanylate cyclase (GGDEF)-like protein